MATNKKITDLTELSESELSDDDVLAIVDISAGTTNKVRKSTLASALSGVASITATSPIAVNQSTGSVVVSTATIPITKGGTGQTSASAALAALGGISDPTTTRGDIIAKGASALGRLAIGANNTVLRSDGTDPEWGAVAASEITGTLPIANGGTNATSASAARTSLGLVIGTDVAAAGANSDITSITGLTTDLTVAQGGTGASTAAAARTNLGLVIGTNVEAFDADIVRSDTTDELTAGYTSAASDAGTKASGTFTPNPQTSNFQHATNGGAHILAPPAFNCTMVILYKNNASAGAIATSGFTQVDGDDLTTTDGHEFFMYITRYNDGAATFSVLTVKALQ